ncbi:MAG: pyrroline-5-carboxylate reductase [Acetobacter sp.]|nr:pyrroline-5-carboxylate reductase [Bacteroides sp.]MCM1340606.1 pyrroline-5-carboxylate reductase [Acetobacter sp.]MCM1433346.1 pyrroline-5-carboxylate reductase [Clostridiales bacterium]
MKLGFIGCGNMAAAIINGIVKSNTVKGEDIFIYDVFNTASANVRAEYSCNICDDEKAVVNHSDIVFLAVKPNVIGNVLDKISNAVSESNPLLISIAAGKTLEFLESSIKTDAKIVRVMPNINAKVSEAISAYCYNKNINDNDIKNVEILLNCFGKCISLDENYFAIFGVIGGCSPAFAYMFIDAMARAAVQNGMKKDDALKISAQAVYGSAKMILENEEHPYKLIDNVCSPGGTTIEGVVSLQSDGFESAIHNAVNKAFEKDKKL